MNALVFAVKGEATAYAGKVDIALGYPAPGVDVGVGRHAKAADSVTLRFAAVLEKTTKDAWAYPANPTAASKEPPPNGIPTLLLDASWADATPV